MRLAISRYQRYRDQVDARTHLPALTRSHHSNRYGADNDRLLQLRLIPLGHVLEACVEECVTSVEIGVITSQSKSKGRRKRKRKRLQNWSVLHHCVFLIKRRTSWVHKYAYRWWWQPSCTSSCTFFACRCTGTLRDWESQEIQFEK